MVCVKDVIPDKIILTASEHSQKESEGTIKFFITRFNSGYTSLELSENNYKISLGVNGNSTPLETEENYIQNENFQYQTKSFFFNEPGEKFKVIDCVETTNTCIFAKLDGNGDIKLSTQQDDGSYFVGTSGHGSFHYFEPKTITTTISS